MHAETSLTVGSDGTVNDDRNEMSLEELEQSIAQVWQEVFDREHIGSDDNFFELGGNSLLAMDITELLSSRLSIQVSVLVLFQHPTIQEMAEAVISADEELL